MDGKIIAVNVEKGKMFVNLKNGLRIEVDAQTTYTHYENGRKDCLIDILSPLNMGGEQIDLGK